MNIASLALNPTTPSTTPPLRSAQPNDASLQVGGTPQPVLPQPTDQPLPAAPANGEGDLDRLLERAAELKIQFKLFENDDHEEDKLGFKVRLREEGAKISFKFKREIEAELERSEADDEKREASFKIQQSFEMKLQFKLEGLSTRSGMGADGLTRELGSVFGEFLSGLAGLFSGRPLDPGTPAAAPVSTDPATAAPATTTPVVSATPGEVAAATPATGMVAPADPQPVLPEGVTPSPVPESDPLQDLFGRLNRLFDGFTRNILDIFGAFTRDASPAPAPAAATTPLAGAPTAEPAVTPGSFELKISFEARISAYLEAPALPAVVSAEA
ncbi:MAG: hypothetical protein Q9Q40_04000 [Acidobacteriota bacterium]|nr:hypothetical protein [Acidobacteriota bacterium]MDQ7088225.1 hypothetical protein [Acidobacteriota bacterium]